jgi:hypothetical protein
MFIQSGGGRQVSIWMTEKNIALIDAVSEATSHSRSAVVGMVIEAGNLEELLSARASEGQQETATDSNEKTRGVAQA